MNGTSIEEEYARGGLPLAKKDGRTNWHKGRTLTPEEHKKLLSFDFEGPDGTIVRRGVGRPAKPPQDKHKPVPFNLSDRLLEGFRQRAKAQGFTNWQEWLRTIGAKEAGLLDTTSPQHSPLFGSMKGTASCSDDELITPGDPNEWSVIRECEEEE